MRFLSILRETWEFLRERRKWWLFPVVLFLVLVGGLIIVSAGSPIAPFIYTLF